MTRRSLLVKGLLAAAAALLPARLVARNPWDVPPKWERCDQGWKCTKWWQWGGDVNEPEPELVDFPPLPTHDGQLYVVHFSTHLNTGTEWGRTTVTLHVQDDPSPFYSPLRVRAEQTLRLLSLPARRLP